MENNHVLAILVEILEDLQESYDNFRIVGNRTTNETLHVLYEILCEQREDTIHNMQCLIREFYVHAVKSPTMVKIPCRNVKKMNIAYIDSDYETIIYEVLHFEMQITKKFRQVVHSGISSKWVTTLKNELNCVEFAISRIRSFSAI